MPGLTMTSSPSSSFLRSLALSFLLPSLLLLSPTANKDDVRIKTAAGVWRPVYCHWDRTSRDVERKKISRHTVQEWGASPEERVTSLLSSFPSLNLPPRK